MQAPYYSPQLDCAIKIIIGSLFEIVNDPRYVYKNIEAPAYSELRSAGKDAILTVIETALPLLVAGQTAEIREHAERLMLEKISK